MQRGEIEGRVIGGRWRFRRADLDAFFANAPRNWDSLEKTATGIRRCGSWRKLRKVKVQGRRADGRFLGFWARLNCENMQFILAWLVRSNLDDPRKIPYMMV